MKWWAIAVWLGVVGTGDGAFPLSLCAARRRACRDGLQAAARRYDFSRLPRLSSRCTLSMGPEVTSGAGSCVGAALGIQRRALHADGSANDCNGLTTAKRFGSVVMVNHMGDRIHPPVQRQSPRPD